MMLAWPERSDPSVLLFGVPVVSTDRGAFHEADDPYDVIDAYSSLPPLEVQASLHCLDKISPHLHRS